MLVLRLHFPQSDGSKVITICEFQFVDNKLVKITGSNWTLLLCAAVIGRGFYKTLSCTWNVCVIF